MTFLTNNIIKVHSKNTRTLNWNWITWCARKRRKQRSTVKLHQPSPRNILQMILQDLHIVCFVGHAFVYDSSNHWENVYISQHFASGTEKANGTSERAVRHVGKKQITNFSQSMEQNKFKKVPKRDQVVHFNYDISNYKKIRQKGENMLALIPLPPRQEMASEWNHLQLTWVHQKRYGKLAEFIFQKINLLSRILTFTKTALLQSGVPPNLWMCTKHKLLREQEWCKPKRNNNWCFENESVLCNADK